MLVFLSVTLVLIWGSAYTMVGVGVRSIEPIWLVAYRLIIGSVLVTAYALLIKKRRFPPLSDPRWRWYFMLGVTGSALPFFLLSKGQVSIDSGVASIIVGAMPLMTVFLAHFFAGEHLTKQKLLGFAIGFLGIVVLFLPDDLGLSLISDWKAQLLIIGGAFCYAFTTVFAKRAPKTPASLGAAMMLICAAIVGVSAAVISGVPDSPPPAIGLLMAIGLGIGSTALATILYLYVIEKTGPTMLARINYFTPLASVFFGVLLLSEPLSWRIALSFAVIVLGVMISRRGPKRPAS